MVRKVHGEEGSGGVSVGPGLLRALPCRLTPRPFKIASRGTSHSDAPLGQRLPCWALVLAWHTTELAWTCLGNLGRRFAAVADRRLADHALQPPPRWRPPTQSITVRSV